MYKIIHNKIVIDVVKHPIFLKFLQNGHITITDKTSADGIAGSDNTVYSFINNSYKKVSIKKIDKKEFKRLQNLLNSDQEIYADSTELAKAKVEKIKILSEICKDRITTGFSIELSNGQYDFKLTTEDQINLMSIENLLASGEKFFIYHATNEPCRIYPKEDMQKIIKAYRAHILYHTTYFNIAKQYINSLTNIEQINRFVYGDNIEDFVLEPVLKSIINNGGKC